MLPLWKPTLWVTGSSSCLIYHSGQFQFLSFGLYISSDFKIGDNLKFISAWKDSWNISADLNELIVRHMDRNLISNDTIQRDAWKCGNMTLILVGKMTLLH